MSNDTTPYFFPDPYNTGEGVSIEAVSLEDALKQLKKQAPKDALPPQDQPQEDMQHPTVKDSALAPEAAESQERTS